MEADGERVWQVLLGWLWRWRKTVSISVDQRCRQPLDPGKHQRLQELPGLRPLPLSSVTVIRW